MGQAEAEYYKEKKKFTDDAVTHIASYSRKELIDFAAERCWQLDALNDAMNTLIEVVKELKADQARTAEALNRVIKGKPAKPVHYSIILDKGK